YNILDTKCTTITQTRYTDFTFIVPWIKHRVDRFCHLIFTFLCPILMDIEGQKRAEHLLFLIIVLAAAISFIWAYGNSDFRAMVYMNGVALLVALLLVIPNWPFFNRHPWQWLPPLDPNTETPKRK
ncbi:hypothetical protein VaNZ11_014795, partial [Volvox africanus]